MLKNLGIKLIRKTLFPTSNQIRNISRTGIVYNSKSVDGSTATKPKVEEQKEEQKPAKPTKEEKPAKEEKPETKYILIEKDGPLTLIGILAPATRNAINTVAAQQICAAFEEFENDEKSTVAVLHGLCGTFCSGYDINELGAHGENISTNFLMQAEGSVGPTRRHIKKPVVCAINGYCVASGLELALMCDLRVMEESATLGFFNRRYGVPLIDGGTARLPSIIGFSRALDLILTGRQVCAEEACKIGLVNRVVATGTALGQAVQLATCLSKFPQAALRHDRNALYSATFETHNFNQACQNEVMYTSKEVIDEMTEGIKKFNEGQGRCGKTDGIKDKSMADWEKEEISKEKPKEKPNAPKKE